MFKMKSYDSVVKCYKRKASEQYIITLRQGHPFKTDESVTIIAKSDFQDIIKSNEILENIIKEHENIIQVLTQQKEEHVHKISELQEKNLNKSGELENKDDEIRSISEILDGLREDYGKALNSYDRMRNSKDHLQERFNKSQEEIIVLERELSRYRVAINKIQSLSLFNRLFNRVPDDIKKLNVGLRDE
jgi:chromosome segregation ATPase